MHIQEARRYPDEAFYFNRGELVIDRAVLPDAVPTLTFVTGASIAAAVEDREGQEQVIQLGWRSDQADNTLEAGARLLRVITGTDRYNNYPEKGQSHCGGEVSIRYAAHIGDLLISKCSVSHTGEEVMVTTPVDQPYEEPPLVLGRYQPAGVITEEGSLVVFNTAITRGSPQGDLDCFIANKLVSSIVDVMMLDHEVRGGSLPGMLAAERVLNTYLTWFAEHKGEDFRPTNEVRDLFRKFPTRLTEAQINRYLS